jgi:aminoglycoside phosphotransferase (APT) family kinase protein
MPSQKTDIATIENEKRLVRNAAGLSSSDEITLNDRGWDSRVYSFGDERYFFKFPRSEKIQGRYKYEIAAIKFVADLHTRIVAQKILWEHPENAYFGYEGVQGKPVSEIIEQLDTAQKHAIGNVLGEFLKHFHELQLNYARTMTLEDEADQIQRWFGNSSKVVHEWFSEDEQRKLHKLVYETWPAQLAELACESVLSHGDLHFENILYGHDGSVGIIDFGDVAYYDRSKDFLELEDNTEIFRAVLETYGENYPNFMQKISLRQTMIQIINLGFHAGKEDEANIKRTTEKIRAKLDN